MARIAGTLETNRRPPPAPAHDPRRGLTIDCPDPKEFSAFFREMLGLTHVHENGDWVVIGDASDRPAIGFHRAEDYQTPTWPDPEFHQQMHLDVQVDDLDDGERWVLELGARAPRRRRRYVPGLRRHARIGNPSTQLTMTSQPLRECAARAHDIVNALADAEVLTFADRGYQGAGGSVRTPFKRHRRRQRLSGGRRR